MWPTSQFKSEYIWPCHGPMATSMRQPLDQVINLVEYTFMWDILRIMCI